MKVGIFTFGSRGDVQPYLALAVGLRQAGHDAFLSPPGTFPNLSRPTASRFVHCRAASRIYRFTRSAVGC